jgi:hypothetical protein
VSTLASAPSVLDGTLGNDGFWPDVPVRAVVAAHRLQVDGRDGALTATLTEAIIETNEALAAAKAAAQAEGHATLAEYAEAHPDEIGGQPVLVTLYLQAVGHWAKAAEVERRPGVDRKPIADGDADGQAKLTTSFLDQHQRTIARILKRMAPDQPAPTNSGVYVASIGDD